jgi:anhydro-N-acetylmuramic acid kinase
MSGTSLDGVDAALTSFDGSKNCQIIHKHFSAYSAELRADLLALHSSGENELECCMLLGNKLAQLYAATINELLETAEVDSSSINAIGCHGQTIRHRPELGFTLQIGNAALLAELTNITVVADFRSRDIAAGGQGAPLVPAFHAAVFSDSNVHRVILNIGGIANLTDLPVNGIVKGFDSGPGNLLMNAWAEQHLGKAYDESGNWAAAGQVIAPLLEALLAHPYFRQTPPKSTGRDMFNLSWLVQYLTPGYAPADVQRTLLELTAQSIVMAIKQYCSTVDEVYLCGGGAHNRLLVQRLQQLLHPVKIGLTDDLGIGADWLEAAAFAWLAKQTLDHAPGNLPAVTGAEGSRILGAVYAR